MQLDEIIISIKQDHPNDDALQDSIHQVDHKNVDALSLTIVCIVCLILCNSVWHFDGHYKVARWNFVIHGAIDGFSRTVFMRAGIITPFLVKLI